MFLKPHWIVDHLTAIDTPILEKLRQRGVKVFLLDLDNTLIIPHTDGSPTEDVQEWLAYIKTMGFQAIVVSNNKDEAYLAQVRQILQLEVIGTAKKPSRQGFLKALAHCQLQPHQAVVVGDRPLTDVWGGHRLGAQTILIPPLNQKEPLAIKFLRRLERLSVR